MGVDSLTLCTVPVVLFCLEISVSALPGAEMPPRGSPLPGAKMSPPTATVAIREVNTTSDRSLGRCETYRSGHICDNWLADETVFVESQFSQELITNYINRTLQFAPDDNSECRQSVEVALCRFALPRCTKSENGVIERAHLCPPSCYLLGDCKEYIYEIVFNIVDKSRDVFKSPRRSFGLVALQSACQPFQDMPLPMRHEVSCLDLEEDHIHTCGGTGNNVYCSLPFSHNGVSYDECTFVNSPDTVNWRPWCKTTRGFAGFKWGFCDCGTPMAPRPIWNTSCELYNAGPVCEPYLNGSTVFIDNRYSQAFLENKVLQKYNQSFYDKADSDTCAALSLQILCHLLFPGCQTSSTTNRTVPVLLCYSSCDELRNSSCEIGFKSSMKKVTEGFRRSRTPWNPVHFYTSSQPCLELPQGDNNNSCVEFNIELPSIENPQSSALSTEVTVLVAVLVPSVSVLLVILLYVWRRKTRKRFFSVADLEFSEIVWDDDVAQAIPGSLIDQKRLELEKQIGEGNFGKVYKGTLDGQTTVAVKGLKSDSQEYFDRQMANSFLREALRMKDLDHPNVMKLIGICWGKKVDLDDSAPVGCGPLIVLPYIEMGDLHGYLRSKRRVAFGSISSYSNILSDIPDEMSKESPVPVDLLLKFGYQIGKGMDYISQQGIVHRDLAARNCMLAWDMKVKVSDFGLARVLEDGKNYYRMGHNIALPVRWMAVESISDLVFTTESDIWSYGVTLWELFSLCTMPYAGLSNQEVISYVQSGDRLGKPDNCPDNLYEMMQRCWMVEITDRPKFSDVVAVIETRLGERISYMDLQPDNDHEHARPDNVN